MYESKDLLQGDESYRFRLLDRHRADCQYYLGYGNRHPRYLWAKNEVSHIANMKALWNSFPENKKPEWLPYDKILEYESKMCPKAILVERDYKGEFERFALTPEEFQKEYSKGLSIIAKDSEGCWSAGAVYTEKTMVHIWFREAVVGDENWNRFFTDMTDGLSQSDIEAGNRAYIREDFMQSLKQYLPDEFASKNAPALDDMMARASARLKRQAQQEMKELGKQISLSEPDR